MANELFDWTKKSRARLREVIEEIGPPPNGKPLPGGYWHFPGPNESIPFLTLIENLIGKGSLPSWMKTEIKKGDY